MNVKLNDMQWRDANVDTLDRWHPTLRACNDALGDLDQALQGFLAHYLSELRLSSDPDDELRAHCEEELVIHVARRLERILDTLWVETV